MADYLKITSRGSIMDAHRQLCKPGTRLTKAQCVDRFGSAKEVDRLVEQGYLVRMYEQTDETVLPLPPQVSKSPPHPAVIEPNERKMESLGKGAGGSNVALTGAGEGEGGPVSTELLEVDTEAMEAEVVTDTGPWNLDPATLADKDVHELNVMIAERRDGIPAFETIEEATAWLSQDFKAEELNIAVG